MRQVLLLLVLSVLLSACSEVHALEDVDFGNISVTEKDYSPPMKLTVPDMKRVDNLPVYSGKADNEKILKKSALHVKWTGYPWQDNRNVYIAGHRLGFEGTESHKVFSDIDELEIGDKIILENHGERWVYEIYRQRTIKPWQSEVMLPIPGKDTVTLQSCTNPDYKERILVVGSLVR